MTPQIAIIADNRLLRHMLCNSLADLPVSVVSNSCEAMTSTTDRAADLTILLHTSPIWCGGAIYSLLRHRSRNQKLYVVAWQQSEQTVLSLLECGVNQYFTLPVSLQRLRRKVLQEFAPIV